jgi:hypothetical protein
MRRTFHFLLAVIVVFTVLFLIHVFSGAAKAPKLSVSFLTFTNDGFGTRCSAFALSNAGNAAIYRISSYRITGPGGRNQDTLTNAPLSDGYSDRVLRPGDSETLLIPTPLGVTAWRARFDFWAYRGRLWSSAEDLGVIVRTKLGMKVQDVRRWGTGMSDVISQE